MAQFEKYYTVEEANAILPELREILTALIAVQEALPADLALATPVIQAVHKNGGGQEATSLLNRMHHLNARLNRFRELGIQIKDLQRGLVDFPTWREDREVFLCWHLGEEEVRFWHDLDSGYSGRQPI